MVNLRKSLWDFISIFFYSLCCIEYSCKTDVWLRVRKQMMTRSLHCFRSWRQELSTPSEAEDRNSRSGGVEDRNSRSVEVEDRNSRSVEDRNSRSVGVDDRNSPTGPVPHSIPCNYDLCFPLFFSYFSDFILFHKLLWHSSFSLLYRVYSCVTSSISIFHLITYWYPNFCYTSHIESIRTFLLTHLYRIHFHFTLYHFLPFAYVLYNHSCFTSELLLSITIYRSIFSSISIESHIFSWKRLGQLARRLVVHSP